MLAALDQLGVPYETLPCDPDLADTAAFCAHYGFPPERSANTIVVGARRPPHRYCACVVLATDRLDVNRAVRDLMGIKRLSFASEEDTAAVTGMMLGGVTPFALPAGLPVYVDAAVMEPEWVILGGGSRSLKLKVPPRVFTMMDGVRIVERLTL